MHTLSLRSRRAPDSYNRNARESGPVYRTARLMELRGEDAARYSCLHTCNFSEAPHYRQWVLPQRQVAVWVRRQAAVTRPRGDTSFVDGALWGPRPCGWPHESGAGRQTNWDTASGPDSQRDNLDTVCPGKVGSCINDLARSSGPPARSGVLDSPLQPPSNRRGTAVPGGPMGVPTASTALSLPVRGRLAVQPACPCLPSTGTPARVPRRMTRRQPKSSGRASTSR